LLNLVQTRVAESESYGVGGFWVESDSDSWQHWKSDFSVLHRLRMSNWIIFASHF